MPITFNSFTPSTKIQSSQVNANFTTIETFLEGLRPQLHALIPDVLSTGTNQAGAFTIKTANSLYLSSVSLQCKTAPTGAEIIVDINVNGSTIFSTRPQIAASATSGGGSAAFSVTEVSDGDVITFDIDQVGSSEHGRDLTITLTFAF